MRARRDLTTDGPLGPVVLFERPDAAKACPIKASLGVIGHKWALIILRDVAFGKATTFGAILRRSPGLTPRVLSARLGELRAEGLIEKVADPTDERVFHYRLTAAGGDAIPILTALIAFGMKHRAHLVFKDEVARTMGELFPGRAREFLGDLYEYARNDRFAGGAGPTRPAPIAVRATGRPAST